MATTYEPAVAVMPPPAGMPQPPSEGFADFDPARMQAFMHKVLGDFSGAIISIVGALGDRLGLFKDLAARGPATSAELAMRTGIHERYAREWLYALTCAGYLDYDPEGRRFALPPEHAAVIAQEGGPLFLGGGYQQVLGLVGPFARLAEAFQTGEGVPQNVYDEDLWQGMERMSATWFEHLLVQQWIPTMPAVEAHLERGAEVADVGCGSGRALIKLAQAFPNSRFTGYDAFDEAVARARANAEAAGVADRLRFQQRNVAEGLDASFDLITTFDAVHDFADVHAGLRAIREALRPDGTYLLLEMNVAETLEANAGPVGALLYGTSVLYNLPVSRSYGGEGLGTMGLPESRIRALCAEVGFSSVRRLPIENPFNVLYAVKP